MKIHVISDLHCDFARYLDEFPECDVAIIAGDVGEDPNHLISVCDRNPMHQIIYVPGNHCFYGASVESRMMTYRAIQNDVCKNLVVLQNDHVEIDGVLFFGSTLWSGLNAYGDHYTMKLKQWYEYNISDSRYITDWSPHLMISEHKYAKGKIAEFFEQHPDQKKVVISHFAPSLNSVHETYRDQVPFNSYWCNGFSDDFVSNADLWVHGHVHNNMDYVVHPYTEDGDEPSSSCRVICNPRGYVTSYGHENPEFNPKLVLEI